MIGETIFSSLKEPLSTAQGIFIFLPQNPNFDQVAASLGLFLSLKKANKSLSLACPTEMRVEFSDLVGIDQVRKELKGRNLVISFDYLEDSIEKVSYNIEGDKFNLVIQPKAGFLPFSPERVTYSYSGGEADLIFTVGAQNLKDLDKLYRDLKSSSDKQTVVNIDINPSNNRFGKVNLIDTTASSCSEIIAHLISRLSLPIDEDIASNLLLGIEKATRNFSSLKVGAATFEAAAFCLRAGARRVKKKMPLQPMPTGISAAKKPEEKKPSPDWFEPKIYKGNTQV